MGLSEQPFFAFSPNALWIQVKDGNPTAISIFSRHYSARKTRKVFQMIGPGEKMLLLTPDAKAVFAWRKFIDHTIPKQEGVNCAVFRREGGEVRASDLIRAADDMAWARWPGERLYTFVDKGKVAGSHPGYCFVAAGWRRCGTTKGGLVILECYPDWSAK